MTSSTKDRDTLNACYRHFLQHGMGIVGVGGGGGRGIATNAYYVARRTGKLPRWVTRGSIAHAAARAGIRHHRATAATEAKQ